MWPSHRSCKNLNKSITSSDEGNTFSANKMRKIITLSLCSVSLSVYLYIIKLLFVLNWNLYKHYWILSTNYFDYVMKYVLHTLQTYIITALNWHIVSFITWPIQNTIRIIHKINICVWVYKYESECMSMRHWPAW